MPDAKKLAGDSAQARAECHIEMAEDDRPQVGVMEAFGHGHCSRGTTVFIGIMGEKLQSPAPDGAARGFGMPLVSGKYVVQPLFLEQHVQRLAQAVQQIG